MSCTKVTFKLNKVEKEIIAKAEKVIKKHYEKEKHPVVTGILDSDNKMFFGLSQSSPSGTSVCAEPCAISQATLLSKSNNSFI